MAGNLPLLLWVGLVIVGIGAMQWGASCASDALDVYRCRAGLRGTAAGALLGSATAAPEISVNIASVWFGWPDLGLGAALGSNVAALPLIFRLSWLSLRSAPRAPHPASVGAAAAEPPIPVVEAAAVEVQAVPYLL